jgi:hypothetical protein
VIEAPVGWRAALALWWTQLRTLRLAPGYALVVLGVAVWLQHTDAATRAKVVFDSSTNVENLSQGHWWVLITSCFVSETPRAGRFLIDLLVIGMAEVLWGRLRSAAVFLYGNVIASLFVYALLRLALLARLVPLRIAFADDVGSSYGLAALLGGLVAYVPARQRPALLAGLILIAVILAALGQTFTDVGHLTALILGIAAGLWLRHRAGAAVRG